SACRGSGPRRRRTGCAPCRTPGAATRARSGRARGGRDPAGCLLPTGAAAEGSRRRSRRWRRRATPPTSSRETAAPRCCPCVEDTTESPPTGWFGRDDTMSGPLRIVHYVNQFFGGIGGEDQAHVGVSVRAGAVGPGRVLEKALGDDARVEATLVCGDNFASENEADAARAIGAELDRLKPDVLVAGPAFGSGRYGLACALACKVAQGRGIPAITAMHPENPGASNARRGVYIVPTGASTTSMQAALDA